MKSKSFFAKCDYCGNEDISNSKTNTRRGSNMYESPIEIMYGEMKMQVVDNVVKAVQEQQIHVDREELIKALRGERNQYQKGFNDAAKEIFAEIEFDIANLDFDREETRAIAIEGVIAKAKNKYIGGVGE